MMRKVINDPSVEVVTEARNQRPGAAPSRIDSDAYHAIEAAYKDVYGATTLPMMSTGATDMAFLRAKGVQCYGVGAMATRRMPPRASARTATRSAFWKSRFTNTCSSSGRR